MHLLDANAFMEASRLYYGFDIAPGFWTWLAERGQHSEVGSVAAIKSEITSGTGDLVTWTESLPAAFWLPDTPDVVSAMTELAIWANDPKQLYTTAAVNEFMGSTDLQLIAHARATGAIVVTREQPAPTGKKRIKIPDVCSAFSVRCTDPFSTYRALGLRLIH